MTEWRLLSAPENVDLSLIPLTEYGLRHGLLTEDVLRRLRAESLPLQNQTGIEFIERYLQNALCENGFLRCFPAEAVHELICAQHADYALIPMNLLEPALTAALLCALDGLPANSLRCAPDAAERLLRGRSASDLAERFAAVLPALCREIHCPPRFQSYLHRCLSALAAVLAQNHPLEKPEP